MEIEKLQEINRERNTPISFLKSRLQEITGAGEELEEREIQYHNFDTLDQVLSFILKSIDGKIDLRTYADQIAELKLIAKEGLLIQKVRCQIKGCRKLRYQIAEVIEESEGEEEKNEKKLIEVLDGKEFKTKKELYSVS